MALLFLFFTSEMIASHGARRTHLLMLAPMHLSGCFVFGGSFYCYNEWILCCFRGRDGSVRYSGTKSSSRSRSILISLLSANALKVNSHSLSEHLRFSRLFSKLSLRFALLIRCTHPHHKHTNTLTSHVECRFRLMDGVYNPEKRHHTILAA